MCPSPPLCDSSALEAACSRIAEEIVHPRPREISLAAEKALKRLDDPNLLPFWVKILTTSKDVALNEIAAGHLKSLGLGTVQGFNREAIQGLSDVLTHARYDKNKKLARSSLRWIATNADDPNVRSLAKGALKGR